MVNFIINAMNFDNLFPLITLIYADQEISLSMAICDSDSYKILQYYTAGWQVCG